MKNEKKKKSIKYQNENVIVPTNEFMQMFFISSRDYKQPNFGAKEIIYSAEKNIDGKCNIRISWDLVSTFPNVHMQNTILENKDKSLSFPIVRERLRQMSTFSREEIIMYLILFNHYVENIDHIDEDGNIVITMKEIHCKYRNKTLKMYSQIDNSTYKSYTQAIKLLSLKKISVDTYQARDKIAYIRKNDIPSFTDYIIYRTPIMSKDGKKLVAIKYNLGKFGKLILTSKRMTSAFPVELLEKTYKEVGQVLIGLYISKILYINRNKKKTDNVIIISVPSILKNIVYYDRQGKNTSKTLLERLNNKEKQKYRLVKNFEENLHTVLKLYQKHGFIKEYQVDSIAVANYNSKATKVKIVVK